MNKSSIVDKSSVDNELTRNINYLKEIEITDFLGSNLCILSVIYHI